MTSDAYTDRCMSCNRPALYSPLTNGICAQCTGTETEAQRAMAAYLAEKNNPRRDIYRLIRLWDDAVYAADKEKEARAAIIKEDDPQ